MTRFDFLATEEHFADHLRPVFGGLDAQERGEFLTERPRDHLHGPVGGDVVVVASFGDFKRVQRWKRPVVWFEHGAGFSYGGSSSHPSYAGGRGRDGAALLPATNRWVQARNQASYPDIPSPIVGCPKLDELVRIPRPSGDVVAISFHWDCYTAPESRSAFSHYERVLRSLAKRFDLLGHAHPRAWGRLQGFYEAAGIEPVKSFEEVCRRASVYAVDTSSTLFEFAALDRPVVLLNAPWYRREVRHGLRFWEHADIGIQVNQPGELSDAIARALLDEPEIREKRRAAMAEIYPHLGLGVERAVSELRQAFEEPKESEDGA